MKAKGTFGKTINVIRSIKTKDQYFVAEKYVSLYLKSIPVILNKYGFPIELSKQHIIIELNLLIAELNLKWAKLKN